MSTFFLGTFPARKGGNGCHRSKSVALGRAFLYNVFQSTLAGPGISCFFLSLRFDATIKREKDSLKAVKAPLEYCQSGHPVPCKQAFPLYPTDTSRPRRLAPDYH